jgi:hypothetical protein
MTEYLNEQLTNRLIGRGSPYKWPLRSPDLTPIFQCTYDIQTTVYERKVNRREDLHNRILDAAWRINDLYVLRNVQIILNFKYP